MRTTFLTYNGDNLAAAQQPGRECDDVKKVPKERIKRRRKEKRRRGRCFEEELDSRDDILYRFKGEKPKKKHNTQQREATEIRRENNTQEKKCENLFDERKARKCESVKSVDAWKLSRCSSASLQLFKTEKTSSRQSRLNRSTKSKKISLR